MEKQWIEIADQLPPLNVLIRLIWDCPNDECMGEVICERTEQGYRISPGHFLAPNEHPVCWIVQENWPQKYIDLNNSYYGMYPGEDIPDGNDYEGCPFCGDGDMDPMTECPQCS